MIHFLLYLIWLFSLNLIIVILTSTLIKLFKFNNKPKILIKTISIMINIDVVENFTFFFRFLLAFLWIFQPLLASSADHKYKSKKTINYRIKNVWITLTHKRFQYVLLIDKLCSFKFWSCSSQSVCLVVSVFVSWVECARVSLSFIRITVLAPTTFNLRWRFFFLSIFVM